MIREESSVTGRYNFVLVPVINVTRPLSYLTSHSLLSICGFLDSITAEVRKRLAAVKSAVAYYIPDRLPLEMVKPRILNTGAFALD